MRTVKLAAAGRLGMQGVAVIWRTIKLQGRRCSGGSTGVTDVLPVQSSQSVFRPVGGVYDTQRDRLAKPNLNINSLPLQLPAPDCVLCCVLRRGDQQDGAVLQAGQDGAGGGPAVGRDRQVGGPVLSRQSGANICTVPGWSGGCVVGWLW